MPKITPFLWFDKEAEEAANYYITVFKNSKLIKVARMGDATAPVVTVEFELDGQRVIALNGGPHYKLSDAFSFSIDTETQEETDYYWNKLLADGGKPSQCGWLKDKFGLSWQVVPRVLVELLQDRDPVKSKRVMDAMMKMVKLDIAALKKAYDAK